MGYKILLADDSVTVQKIVTLTFSDEGVDVIPVNTGDEAISRLHYTHPALVMADVSLPGKNGYEICEFVKNHPELKHTPVVLLVPAFEAFDEERAARVGANHHLTKPFQSIRALIATVKNLIDPPAKDTVQPIVWPTTEPPATALTNGLQAEPERFAPASDTGAWSQPIAAVTSVVTVPPTVIEPVPEGYSAAAGALGGIETATSALVQPGNGPLSFDLQRDQDDVLELDDVLPPAVMVVAPPKFIAPALLAPAGTITQAVKLTSVEAITTTSIPQSVIDDIAARVTSQVSLQLAAQFSQFATQMFEHLTTRLALDIAPRVANEVLARLNPPVVSPGVLRTETTDAVLDI